MKLSRRMEIAKGRVTASKIAFLGFVLSSFGFAYSFIVSPPSGLQGYNWMVKNNHYLFLQEQRWHFFGLSVFFFLGIFWSLYSAHRLMKGAKRN